MHSWLPVTAYALLGLMSFGEEFTGYQLERRAAISLRHFFWSPAMSQIYTELRRLEELGLVSQRQQQLDELRAKRVYRITDAGRAELARWVGEGPADPPNVLKHLTCLRALYGHLVPPDVLRARLDEHVAWAERGRSELEQVLSVVKARSADDPRWHYTALVIEWGMDYYAGEAAGAARLADRLSRLPSAPAARRRGSGTTARRALQRKVGRAGRQPEPDAGPPTGPASL